MPLHRVFGTTALAAAVLVAAVACSPIGPGAGASDPSGSGSGSGSGSESGSGSSSDSSAGSATGAATASAAVKAATCKALDSSLDDITSKLSSTAGTFVDDPSAAVSALESASTTVQGVVAEIQDPRAKTLVRDVSDDLGGLTTAVQNAAEHPITGAPRVQRALSAVQLSGWRCSPPSAGAVLRAPGGSATLGGWIRDSSLLPNSLPAVGPAAGCDEKRHGGCSSG